MIRGTRTRITSGRLFALAGLAAVATGAGADTAEPTKSNGDFIAGTNIDASGFLSDSNGDVSVYLKARGRPGTGYETAPLNQTGNTYTVLTGFDPSGVRTWWNWDFQFTPSDDATGTNTGGTPSYGLGLFFDTDPTGAMAFGAAMPGALFDADTVNDDSTWDDNDGFFVNPGPGGWSDDDKDYVYSQSWRYEFGSIPSGAMGLPAASLGPGDYTIRWAAYADESATATDNPMVVTDMTVRVVDASMTGLTLDAQTPCVQGGGSVLVVEVNLVNAQDTIEGGQFVLAYDNTKLDFVSADPVAPFASEIYETVDEIAGEIEYGVGSFSGGSSSNATMATLTFNVIGDFCSTDDLVMFDETGILPNRLTNNTGGDYSGAVITRTDLNAITSDATAPTLSIPSDVTQNADAGLCTAFIDPGVATATDDCSDNSMVTVNWTRSDSATSLLDPYPTGTTTITWTAEDECGNQTIEEQTITVNASNTLNVNVDLESVTASMDRCITFELIPTGGGTPIEVTETISFVGGSGTASFDIPCGSYECITARDTLHTLRETDSDDFMISGTVYDADFTGPDELRGGNLNGDAFVDILDFGIFIGQFGNVVNPNTPCHSFVVSTDRTAYEGTFARYPTQTDAENETSAITPPTAIPDRATTPPYDTPSRDVAIYYEKDSGFFPDFGAILSAWYYTTMTGSGLGSGNPSNTNLGFLQLYDADFSTITASDGCFENFDGTYYTDFRLQISGENAPYSEDFSRLWNVPSTSSSGASTGGTFVSYELDVTFTGLEGSDVGGGFIEANDHPDGVSGTFTAIFENTDLGGSDDTAFDGWYRTDLTFNMDSWAFGEGYMFDAGGNIPGIFDSYFYGTECLTVHADVDGSGIVDTADFDYISFHFFEFDEVRCDGSLLDGGDEGNGPIDSISVKELRRLGMKRLVQADLNGDGMLDTDDVVAFMNGERPDRAADLDGDGIIGYGDLGLMIESLTSGSNVGDINDDGVVDHIDLGFVAARLNKIID